MHVQINKFLTDVFSFFMSSLVILFLSQDMLTPEAGEIDGGSGYSLREQTEGSIENVHLDFKNKLLRKFLTKDS